MKKLKRILLTILGAIIIVAGFLTFLQASDINPLLANEKWQYFISYCYFKIGLLMMVISLLLGAAIVSIGALIIEQQRWFPPEKSLKDFIVGEKIVFVHASFWCSSIFQKLSDYKEGVPFKEMKNTFRLKEYIPNAYSSCDVGKVMMVIEKEEKYRSFGTSPV